MTETGPASDAGTTAVSGPSPPPPPSSFVTTHDGTFSGRDISYRCVAAETYLEDREGKPRASIFSFSYIADEEESTDEDASAPRPVTFVFNGGPGSSSMWLHMGAIGPRIVILPSDATSPGAGPVHRGRQSAL